MFPCVLMIVCVSTGSEEFQLSRGFDQGLIYLRVRPRVALGPAKQLAAHPRRSIPRALVAGLETLDYGCEDRYAGDGAAAFGHRGGLGGKAILLINGEFRAETTRSSKCGPPAA